MHLYVANTDEIELNYVLILSFEYINGPCVADVVQSIPADMVCKSVKLTYDKVKPMPEPPHRNTAIYTNNG